MNASPLKEILIVDDEPDLRDIVAFDFKKEGYRVRCAGNGREAFESFREKPCDLIITDVHMPVWDGVTLLSEIKKLAPSVPVLMFVTSFTDRDIEEVYDKGAEALFPKPFNRQALKDAVKLALKRQDGPWSRVWERHKVELRVNVDFSRADEQERFCHLANIGRGGAFISSSGKIPATGEKVSFEFIVDDDRPIRIRGEGTVKWVRETPSPDGSRGFGVEFVSFSGDSRRRFMELINAIKTVAYIPKN